MIRPSAIYLSLFLLIIPAAPSCLAQPSVTGKMPGQLLTTGSKKVLRIGPDGKTLWKHKAGNAHDAWMLDNGRILLADGKITEIDPQSGQSQTLYQSTITRGGGCYSCQPLTNDQILVCENSTSKLYEINREGKISFELQLPLHQAGSHHNLRMARKLANGNYLVCHSGKHRVREYTPEGKVVQEIKLDNIAFAAVRLPNGNTLVSHIDAITEFSPAGKAVWSFHQRDATPLTLGSFCGIHVLPNNHIVIGVYAAYKKGGQAALLEISRDKKIIWKYANPKGDRSMMSVQMLSPQGKALAPQTLR